MNNRLGMLVSQSWTSGSIDSMRYDASGNLLKKIMKPFGQSYRTQQFTMTTAGAISNRLAKDSTSTEPFSMEFAYTAEGSRQVENPTTSAQGQIGLWRAYFYDGLGRMSGYKYYQLNGSGGWDWVYRPTACGYDGEGNMRAPCDGKYYVTLSFEGANATQTSDGWRFFHAPGTDEPLLAIQREGNGYVNHELYFVTDGSGRQLALGKADGSLHDSEMPDHEFWTTRGIGWRRAGATQGGRGFGADRLAGPETAGLSYFRNRAYDARTGRWTQEDPIGVAGGLNLYQFNGNNPVAYTDPFGLCPDACVIEGGIGAAAVLTGLAVAAIAVAHGDDLSDAAQEGYDAGKRFVGSIVAAVSGKILEVRLAGQERNIANHFGKLSNPLQPGGEDPNTRDKWKRDIQKGIREMKKLADRLKGKDAEKWGDRIKAIEDQVSTTQ